MDPAPARVLKLLTWYKSERLHSAIGFVTPS